MEGVDTYEFELFADYFQFYLQDDDAAIGNLSDAWTEEATANLIAVAPGTVGIGTARNMTVPVVIEIRRAKPGDSLDEWDHVVEAGLTIRSGALVVAGCTDFFPDAARLPLAPGEYRVRLYAAGLRSVSPDGLEGDDRYRVVIWPGNAAHLPVVLKRFVP
jgi:hypothetical protein